MKIRKSSPIISLVLILGLTVGLLAGFAAGRVQPTRNTETPLSASTVTPVETMTPTLIPTSEPTGTPTAIPTLPADAAHRKLFQLLTNNGGCILPCLWGIKPGKSTYQEARNILEPLRSISNSADFISQGGSISPFYDDGDLRLFTTVGFTPGFLSPDDQIISRMSFRVNLSKVEPTGFLDIFNSVSFGQQVKYYMLPNILAVQGAPDTVLISTDAGSSGGKNVEGFYIVLFYPYQGLLISYTTSKQLIGDKVQGCPANAHVEIELYSPPRNLDTFSEDLAQTKWAHLWPAPTDSLNWKSIEKATSMTMQQFYGTFVKPTDKCIETPAKLWPAPKPGGG